MRIIVHDASLEVRTKLNMAGWQVEGTTTWVSRVDGRRHTSTVYTHPTDQAPPSLTEPDTVPS